MHVWVVTLFPELVAPFFDAALIGKAAERGLVRLACVNPRDFTDDRHRTVDDTPYGGGSGMVLMPGPMTAAIESCQQAAAEQDLGPPRRLLLTPQGRRFRQSDAERLAHEAALVLVCGRYEGVDERVRAAVDEEISLGDFVTLGGETPAMVILEAILRLLPGVLGNACSPKDESHQEGLLEYPHYTRPPTFRGVEVPAVLRSGDHEAIRRFRRRESLRRTLLRRPDLLEGARFGAEDRALLNDLRREHAGRDGAPPGAGRGAEDRPEGEDMPRHGRSGDGGDGDQP